MSMQVVAEYPEENFALIRDNEGIFIFDRGGSILPIDDEPVLTLCPRSGAWKRSLEKTRIKFNDTGFEMMH